MTHEKQERIQGQGGATPGPWQVYDSHPQAACLYIDSAGKGHSFGDIATVYSEPLPARENAANAKLIAAAPDHALLLAAITARQAGMRVRRMYPGQGDAVFVGKAAAYPVDLDAFGCPILTDELRAALRKAGREP